MNMAEEKKQLLAAKGMTDEKIGMLIRESFTARTYSYSPYSHYAVGAALLASDGTLFRGCNIENAAYGTTNCAERTALFKAVSEGFRSFTAICICAGPDNLKTDLPMGTPCGACRQALREFCAGDFIIITASSETDYDVYTLDEMLPASFGPEFL